MFALFVFLESTGFCRLFFVVFVDIFKLSLIAVYYNLEKEQKRGLPFLTKHLPVLPRVKLLFFKVNSRMVSPRLFLQSRTRFWFVDRRIARAHAVSVKIAARQGVRGSCPVRPSN